MKVLAIRAEKIEHYDEIFTLAKNRVSSSARCEVNMIRK